MRLFDNIGYYLNALKVNLFGKGFMTLAVLGASVLSAATGMAWVLPVVAIGGVAVTIVSRFYREGQYRDQMVDLYRDDIANQLGIPPKEVTRAHLKEAAKDNDVIAQALTRQRHKTWIAIGTAVLSAVSTVLLVSAFGLDHTLHDGAFSFLKKSGWGVLANFVGVGTVASISSLVFKGGLQTLLDVKTGSYHAAAHDRIVEMEQNLKHGHAVTKEQVYTVMADGNPALRTTIIRQFRESYDHMTPAKRSAVLEEIGIAPEMQALADEINQRNIRPGKLAFMLQEATHPAREPVGAPEAAVAPEQPRSNFVERLNLAPRQQQSYRSQVDAERAVAAAPRGLA